jgi:surface protein
MAGMFQDSGISTTGNLNSWDTSSVTEMNNIFMNATLFNQPLNNWDVSGLDDMTAMFDGATSFNQPLDQWDTSNVQYTEIMMRDTTAFDQDLSSWDMTANIDLWNMFDGSGMSAKNYDKLLKSWSAQALQSNQDLGADGLLYCDQASHDILTNTFGWTIHDDALAT